MDSNRFWRLRMKRNVIRDENELRKVNKQLSSKHIKHNSIPIKNVEYSPKLNKLNMTSIKQIKYKSINLILNIKRKIWSNIEIISVIIVILYLLRLFIIIYYPTWNDFMKLNIKSKEQIHWILMNMGLISPYYTLNNYIKHTKITKNLNSYSVVIAGMVKNSEKTLPLLLNEMDILACFFDYTHFFVFESNSNDNTRNIIKEWGNNSIDCSDIQDRINNFKLEWFSWNNMDFKFNLFDYDKDIKYEHISQNEIYNDKLKKEYKEINQNIQENIGNIGGKKWRDMIKENRNEISKKKAKKRSKDKAYNINNNNNDVTMININAKIDKTIYQPNTEFDEIKSFMNQHQTNNINQIREDRYVVYRNYLLNNIKEWTMNNNDINIDYLIWIDMDLTGIDLISIFNTYIELYDNANENSDIIKYDVICGNGIKYGGWYYDSYASVLYNNEWLHGYKNYNITNSLLKYKYYEMNSCFGGFVSYDIEALF